MNCLSTIPGDFRSPMQIFFTFIINVIKLRSLGIWHGSYIEQMTGFQSPEVLYVFLNHLKGLGKDVDLETVVSINLLIVAKISNFYYWKKNTIPLSLVGFSESGILFE